MSTIHLTAAQARALTIISERGHLAGGTGGSFGIGLPTVRALANLGLIQLVIRTHNANFGGGRTQFVNEWQAAPIDASK